MLFSGLTFLYGFLPAVLALYFPAPKKLKNGVLLLASLFFYAWGEPRLAWLMLVTIGGIFGNKFEKKAEFLGGAVLILLGCKILLESLGIL